MGELIPGIGDEVLLFGTFLTLTAGFYVGLLIYKSRSQRQNVEQADQPANAGGHREEPTTTSQSDPPHNAPPTLRSRFNPMSGTEHTEAQQSTGQEETAQPDGGLISVRLIKSASDSVTVRVSPNTTLQQLRSSYFRQESAESRPISFIFRGHVLNDGSATLDSLGITDGRAVHVHVGRPRPQGEEPHAGPEAVQELDLSRLFVPLFGVILGLVWVSMLMYPSVFNLITKFFLFLLSLGYVLIAYITTFS